MSTATAGPADVTLGNTLRPRDPSTTRFLAGTAAAIVMAIVALSRRELVYAWREQWPELLFWMALLLIVNLFPVRVGDLTLTIDMPILVTIALLYPPGVAAAVVALGALDVRELTRDIPATRVVFNRSQISLTIFCAGVVFHSLSEGLAAPWPRAFIATAAAVATAYSLNVFFVFLYRAVRNRSGLGSAVRGFSVGGVQAFLAVYLGYSMLALVLGRLFVDVGAWSVVTFLVPTIVAHQLLVRSQQLQGLAAELRSHEQLLERQFTRIVDERRDERLRVAGDLHDDVLQNMTKVWMQASLLQRVVPADAPMRADLDELVDNAILSVNSVRAVIGDLRESPLGRGGLVPTLQGLTRELQLDWRTKVRFDASGDLALPPDIQVVLYQVAREAILNALKHARASEITVGLQRARDRVSLVVEDDGRGFDRRLVDDSSHFGLRLMEERVQMIGGLLELMSGAGGTCVRVTLAVHQHAGRDT